MPRYAAIDIGSNSTRMMAADASPQGIKILAQERQVTRLGSSVFATGRISEDALNFLCETLAKMAAAYKKYDVVGVRAVATSAVRDASNQEEFAKRASEVLGTNIEIISGSEEARLIHLGVETRWPRPKERTLIIDVGGGSAELILSQGGDILEGFSKPLGAVRLTEVFLKSDLPTPQELQRLDQYIKEKLISVRKKMGIEKFDRAIATSATAAAMVCAINQIPRMKRDEADRLRARTSQIRAFHEELIRKNLNARKKMMGIGPRRAEIITAGATVFLRTLEAFGHHSLYYSVAGVRDGIIADLAMRGVGREYTQLSREQRQVVETMARRYGVLLKHTRAVASLSHQLFELLHPIHKLAPPMGKLLEAAAYLHDVGHFVSDTSHHKHSAYLVANSDLPGFTNRERQIIASLCRFHRKALPSPRYAQFQALDTEAKRAILLLTPILRLGDALDRGHEQKVQRIDCQLKLGAVTLLIHAERDADLELWAANEAAEAFRQVYEVRLSIQRARS